MLAQWVPGELLVQFDPDAGPALATKLRDAIGAELLESIQTPVMKAQRSGVLERVALPEGWELEQALRYFGSAAGVRFAEPNWIYATAAISNDPRYTNGSLWGVYSNDLTVTVGPTGTTNTFGSQAEKVWNAGYTGSSSVVVGVIDEGIQVTHPDLAANIWVNPHDPVDGVDNDGNGYIDDTHGWDFVSNDRTVYDGTSDDHGTHVAGTIGAVGGNGVGVAGVNWNVTMVSLKFLGTNGGTTANAIKAVDYLTDLKTRHGMNIVTSSNSWGGGGFSQGLLDAITRGAQQQILFVAAAGNSNSNNNTGNYFPSNYNTTAGAGYDAVISVASITNTGAKSSFSSYGSTTVDLGAPGSAVVSTVPNNGYASYNGTSMATPHVSGAVALYRSVAGNRTAAETRAALLGNTTATTSLNGITVTGGRLDVARLVSSALSPTLAVQDQSMVEGNAGTSGMLVTVTLSQAAIEPVTVSYATSNGTAIAVSDYLASSGSLTFAPGTTSMTVTVPIVGDGLAESEETFRLNLSNPSQASIVDAQAILTIVDNDPLPVIVVSAAEYKETDKRDNSVVYQVSLSAAYPVPVEFIVRTAAGTATSNVDYREHRQVVSFAPGETSAEIKLRIAGDSLAEQNETFQLLFSNPQNATLSNPSRTVTIIDDDGPPLLMMLFARGGSDEEASVRLAGTAFTAAPPMLVPGLAIDPVQGSATTEFRIDGPVGPSPRMPGLRNPSDGGLSNFTAIDEAFARPKASLRS